MATNDDSHTSALAGFEMEMPTVDPMKNAVQNLGA
jgi:hypothetical protein